MEKNQNKNLMPRPPIVVIIGHVDHGKTTLLDYIRKTNVAAKEAGGITQSTGAYEIIHNDKKITFIDTPGHEAFFKMRERGAKVADLAILVVAADDGVKPQTKESIDILNSTKTPFVVAINKIDKPNTDIEKTKNDLMANGVLLEGYGGHISWQAISAKTGQGIDELLDLILLTAEMENLTYDPKAKASGIIIEAKTNPQKGIVISAIVKNGALKIGDFISTPTVAGKIKVLEDFLGNRVEKLIPSSPVLISGFDNLPQVGEEFTSSDIDLANSVSPKIEIKPEKQTIDRALSLNLIIKADVAGSLEALSGIIKNLKYKNANFNILSESVGEITDGDIKAATPTNAVIIGFKTKINKIAENLAKVQSVKIIVSEIIYELIEAIENEIKLKEKPLPLGEIEILKIFNQKGKKQLIGGRVVSGAIKNNIRLKIVRNNEEIGTGKILNLKHQKTEINEAKEGQEFGLIFESDITINEKDRLIWNK